MVSTPNLLRIACWTGAVLDAAMLFPMLSPDIGGAMFGLSGFQPGPEYRYAMGIGAALMAGWTVLLLWADRKPIERRGILWITVVPVIFGMIAANLYAVGSGLLPLLRSLPMFAMQILLLVLFVAAYLHSNPQQMSGLHSGPA